MSRWSEGPDGQGGEAMNGSRSSSAGGGGTAGTPDGDVTVGDEASGVNGADLVVTGEFEAVWGLEGEDVTDEDVTGEDVTGEDVTGEDVTGEDVTGEDVTGEDVTGEDIGDADVVGAGAGSAGAGRAGGSVDAGWAGGTEGPGGAGGPVSSDAGAAAAGTVLERGGELSLEHRAVEAVVLCAVEPVPLGLLAELLELPPARVERVCDELAADYRAQRRGFVLAKVAGGYRYQTDPELAPFVERFAMEGVSARLSSAALETLAIVAYKQPVSRAQVAALRGVNVDGVVRLLNQRGLIAEVGHAPGPGQPVLYGTTPAFLEKLGLDSIDQLPAVEDLFPGPEVVEVLEAKLRPGADAP